MQSLCQTSTCQGLRVNISLVPVKNKIAGTNWNRLKLSALHDLLEIPLGSEASGSSRWTRLILVLISKAKWWMLTVTPDAICITLKVKRFTASTLPDTPPSHHPNGQIPEYKCWLHDTRLFHFCLDKSALLYDFSSSAFILNLTASCNEAYIQVFFLLTQRWLNCLYHHPLQTKKPLKQPRKPSNHQPLSNRR